MFNQYTLQVKQLQRFIPELQLSDVTRYGSESINKYAYLYFQEFTQFLNACDFLHFLVVLFELRVFSRIHLLKLPISAGLEIPIVLIERLNNSVMSAFVSLIGRKISVLIRYSYY